MKAGNGGEISVKMALNGNSKPSKVMNIDGPNEVCFVIVIDCSEMKENDYFRQFFRQLHITLFKDNSLCQFYFPGLFSLFHIHT